MNSNIKLSVVIPSYNSSRVIGTTLESLERQVLNREVEVLVVDCSENNEVDIICNQFEFVRLLKVGERFNPGKGRNIGAEQAQGKALLFMDSDVVLKHDAISCVLDHVNQGSLIFGGALELNKKSVTGFSSYVEHYYFNHESQSTRESSQRNNLSSALMVVDRSLFLSVGGFSDIPRMQDTELTERIVRNGIYLDFFPDVVGYQTQDSPLSKVLKKVMITGNNLYFIRYSMYSSVFSRLLISLMVPLLMLFKISRINYRNIRYVGGWYMVLAVSPTMYLCGLYWLMGLYKALLFQDGIEGGR